jgi:hypothetical protein
LLDDCIAITVAGTSSPQVKCLRIAKSFACAVLQGVEVRFRHLTYCGGAVNPLIAIYEHALIAFLAHVADNG